MSKKINSAIVSEVARRLSVFSDFIVCDFSLVNAVANNSIRSALRRHGFFVISLKNSTARKIFSITDVSKSCESVLSRSSTLICGASDIVELSKKSLDCLTSFPLASVKGGISCGVMLSQQEVIQASTSPSRDELLSRLVNYILSPGGGVVSSVQSVEQCILFQVHSGATDIS